MVLKYGYHENKNKYSISDKYFQKMATKLTSYLAITSDMNLVKDLYFQNKFKLLLIVS